MDSQLGLVKSRGLQPQAAATQSVTPSPKDEVVLQLARLLCVANEILAAWAEVAKLEACIQASAKRTQAIDAGCYPPCPPPHDPYSYGPTATQDATGGPSVSARDYAWTQLAALLRICTGAAYNWAASYKSQSVTTSEQGATKATGVDKAEAEQKPTSKK